MIHNSKLILWNKYIYIEYLKCKKHFLDFAWINIEILIQTKNKH